MSRTDKDRPWQLRALDGDYGLTEWGHTCDYRGGRDCDIDADPIDIFKHSYDNEPRHRHLRRWRHPSCGYSLTFRAHYSVPHWYVDHVWNAPERTRERSKLREMAKDYNTNGTVADEGDFPCPQHRHNAARLWM